jgi:hypothetical protein
LHIVDFERNHAVRDRPEDGAALSLVLLAPLIAQVEFDRDVAPHRRALVAAAQQAIFAFVSPALGLLALILTVAAVHTVAAAIVPGCFGKRGLSCRGTKSSNPSPSSVESAANLPPSQRGTEGSNPSLSSGESTANLPHSAVEDRLSPQARDASVAGWTGEPALRTAARPPDLR